MTNDRVECPKCSGEMMQGFVPDYSYAQILVGRWHEGQAEKSFWSKTKTPSTEGIPIGAFRCQRCGFLEFYADPGFAAE
jgi:hypothetical protein